MRLIIDLDGTLCTERLTFSRCLADPLEGAVEAMRMLKGKGVTLIIYSARTWAEYEMTVAWLKLYGIPYDQLVLGKPIGDYWIDDRAIKFTSWKECLAQLDSSPGKDTERAK